MTSVCFQQQSRISTMGIPKFHSLITPTGHTIATVNWKECSKLKWSSLTVETHSTYSTLFAIYRGCKLLHFRIFTLFNFKLATCPNDHEAKLVHSPSNKLPCSWSISDVIYVSWFSLFCCADFYQRFCLRDLHKQHFVTCLYILIFLKRCVHLTLKWIAFRRNACTPPVNNYRLHQHNFINSII
ncbi:hypothetical protein T07_13523 [Trichinella nelsoni]|uniref:Uncharacterized protein n=1 Tax=Trichinella nelsoni TaxID=6336 RepID=A0A0V0RWZ0_9BILA|nr:hypothetical protein T07_13523 [Trichinella nelsoni]